MDEAARTHNRDETSPKGKATGGPLGKLGSPCPHRQAAGGRAAGHEGSEVPTLAVWRWTHSGQSLFRLKGPRSHLSEMTCQKAPRITDACPHLAIQGVQFSMRQKECTHTPHLVFVLGSRVQSNVLRAAASHAGWDRVVRLR